MNVVLYRGMLFLEVDCENAVDDVCSAACRLDLFRILVNATGDGDVDQAIRLGARLSRLGYDVVVAVNDEHLASLPPATTRFVDIAARISECESMDHWRVVPRYIDVGLSDALRFDRITKALRRISDSCSLSIVSDDVRAAAVNALRRGLWKACVQPYWILRISKAAVY